MNTRSPPSCAGGGRSLTADLASGEIGAKSAADAAATEGSEAQNSDDADAEDLAAANPYAHDFYTDAAKAPSVTHIFIPASIETIDPAFFQLFPNAASIEVAEGNAAYTSYNGMLFGVNDAHEPTHLLLVPEGMEGNAVLPETLATVPACVFSRCIKLSAITAAQAEGSTGDIALTSQDGILYTSDKTTLIAAPAGLGASATIAPECTTIAEGAFWGNDNLKTIVATGAVETIETGKIAQMSESVQANASSDPATADPYEVYPAFNEDTVQNATVTTPDRTAWEAAGFKNFAEPAKPGDESATDDFAFMLLPDYTLRVRWAGEGAAPEDLTIPSTGTVDNVEYAVSTIAEDAFKGQEGIRKLTVPEGISAIGARAFAECTSLESVKLAGSVTFLGEAAIQGCTSLSEIDLGGGLRTLSASALENTALATITLPASLTSIGARALAANANLDRVVALGDIAEVDSTVLADCSGVEIYTPYRTDETYAWRAGVPATANHLLPYGVSLASEAITLNQDETASLLEGGYLEAAGSMDVQFAYNAAPISVDPSSGTITAKQTGKTTVTVNLVLDGRTLASASRPVVVALAPQPVEEEVEETDDGHNHADGEECGEEGCAGVVIDNPEVSYKDQLFEEGDYYTSGNFEAEEKVINRSVALSDMDADISTMSLTVPSVGDYNRVFTKTSTVLGGAKNASILNSDNKSEVVKYEASTQTLTIKFDTQSWLSMGSCGGSVGCSTAISEGSTTTHTSVLNWRSSRNKLNAVRKLVLINFDAKNPKFLFSKMMNLEEVEIQGNFMSNSYNSKTSGATSVESMFEDCPQLRVIPSNMTLPSTVTNTTDMFGFSSDQLGNSTTSYTMLNDGNQFVNGKILTCYSGSNSSIVSAINNSTIYKSSSDKTSTGRSRVASYHAVTFDNQGGTGGHQTAGQSTSATTKTYTIKVPTGSPVPELIGTPTYSGWTLGGYVDALNNAPKEYVNYRGYPVRVGGNTSGGVITFGETLKVTSNMTLKALWYHRASFNGNGGTVSGTVYATMLKGYPVAMPTGFDSSFLSFHGTRLQSTGGNVALSIYIARPFYNAPDSYSVVGGHSEKLNAPSVSRTDGRSFKGYTLASSTGDYAYSTAYYDANCNGTSQIYNEPKNFYAMWGYYTISFYSNVALDWKWNDTYHNSSNQGVAYGNSGTGTSGADYTSAFQIQDAYSYTRWNSGFFNIRNSSTAFPTTSPGNPNNYAINYRDVTWTAPAYHDLDSIHLGSADGTVINGVTNFNNFNTLSSNVSIYLIFKDNTPNDTIKWVANGGYLNGDTKITEKSDTVRRGNKVTAPTIARTSSSTTRYTFLGWYSGDTKVCDAGGQVTANGSATYTAKWKTEYKIIYKTGLTGAYWGSNTKDTADKEFWTESGGAVPTTSLPKKDAIANNTRWTATDWDKKVVAPVTGPATYTAQWKTEYCVTWKLGVDDAYWANPKNANDKSDKANKTTWVESGKDAAEPATPKRDSGVEYTYSFKSWDGGATNITSARTLTASWNVTVNKYDITWNANGGYWGTNTSDTGNKKTTGALGNTKWSGPAEGVPKRTHFTFAGWAESTSGSPSKEITVTKSTTYYAIWSTPYGFTIDPNGGEFKTNDTGITGRSSLYLWTNNFTVQNGWISFNVQKGDGTYSNKVTFDGTKVQRPGWTLSHWEWSGGVNGTTSGSSKTFNGGLSAGATYKAIWTEDDATIKYEVGTAGGGSVTRASETVKTQNGTLAGSQPKHSTGWHFIGWNTKADGTGTTLFTDETRVFAPDKQAVSGWDYSLNASATYYAIFTPNEYTIELKKNDGTDGYGATVGTVSAKYDTPWTVRAGNVPNLRGYYFLGWSTDPDYAGMTPEFSMLPDADGKFQDTQFTKNLTAAEDENGNWVPTTVTLYAVWNESRYTVVFHENWDDDPTGTGTVPTRLDLLYTQQVEIPTTDLARTGYNFASWNTKADGSGTTYKTRGKYTHVGLADFKDAHVRGCVVHLYAQWDANQYIVQFDPNILISDPQDKGEWHIESGDEVKLVQYGQEVTIDTIFSRPGYEFIGWSLEKNVSADENDTPIVDFRVKDDGTFDPGTFTNLTTDKLGLVRLYAQWKGGGYTIEFDGNASDDRPVTGGPIAALDMHYGVAKKLPANTFACNGYTFKGWNTEADGTGTSYLDQALVQDIPGVSGGKVTLYAQWAPILSLTSPIDACIEVYIDGMDMYVYEVRAAKSGWPTGTPNGDGTKDDHEDEFTHGQAALESRTPAKLFIEQIDCIPNLDPEEGMARIFPVEGEPSLDSWEDFELEFTALNEATGKNVKASTEFGNSYAFVPGAKNNYYIPAADATTGDPGRLEYTLLLRIPDAIAKKPNTVRYAEGPVKIATLMFTCRVAD